MSFCALCSKEALALCSKCKSIAYCSRECQKTDWPNHKKQCNFRSKDVDLLQYCLHLARDALRKHLRSLKEINLHRNKFFFERKKSKIPGAGRGIFAKREKVPKDLIIGIGIAGDINDADRAVPVLFRDSKGALDIPRIKERISEYEKSKERCNAVYYLDLTASQPFGTKTLREINKGEEIVRHYFPEQWIIMDYVMGSNGKLSDEDWDALENLCKELIGKDTLRALITALLICPTSALQSLCG